MRTTDDCLIGYLTYHATPQRTYYGGILITDTHGLPNEFRHTEAIKPTFLQLTLYGDSLESSLGTDAIAPALYNGITHIPDLLLIDKPGRELFGRFASLHPPSALILTFESPQLALSDFIFVEGNLLEPEEYEIKGSGTDRLYAYIEEKSDRVIGASVLKAAQKRMNLLSPFNRIKTVLSQIADVDQNRSKS